MSTSHSQITNYHVTNPHTTVPLLAQDIVCEGYVSYQQALHLGFVPTPQSLYTVIVTTIRDVHHPDAYNVAYLLGWLVAYYESTYHQQHGIKQHLSLAFLHLCLVSVLFAQQEVQP